MLRKDATVARPQRWDIPFGADMTTDDVGRLLKIDPFAKMNPMLFPASCPLPEILLNDARILRFQKGDIIVREGDYGNSAFMILDGSIQIALSNFPNKLLGRSTNQRRGLFHTLATLWRNPRLPEVRDSVSALESNLGQRTVGETTRIFLQDVPGILDKCRTIHLEAGEIFGEVAALARTPRTATAFALEDDTELLEIRWQGLRELMKRDAALKNHIHQLYRQNSLLTHLRETPLLDRVDEVQMHRLVNETQFETHGDFEWFRPFKSSSREDIARRIAAEPLIAEEGGYVDGLILVRSGFARVSRRYGHGHRTLSYLGKGEVFGFPELAYNWMNNEQIPCQLSLRALGYVDILRIPSQLVEDIILPHLGQAEIGDLCEQASSLLDDSPRESDQLAEQLGKDQLDPGFHEFLGQHQFINGRQAMLIDLDRCTRCDDCVRACASTHENNPRFVREGLKYGSQVVASACMHCIDPVCMIGCPTGAIGRDAKTGNVLINDLTCIGCSTCANSCAYDNIRMVEIRDRKGRPFLDKETERPIVKATKCDFCTDQIAGPACQRACPHDALIRMDLGNTERLAEWCNR